MEEAAIVSDDGKEEQPKEINARTMSYEDLNKALNEEVHTEEVETPKEEPPKEELKDEPKVESEPPKEEPPKEDTPPKAEPPIDYEAKFKELETRVASKEQFIQRQANEIGLLRKQNPQEVRDQIQAVEAEYDRIYAEQGKFAADQFWKGIERQREAAIEEQRTVQNINHMKQTRERVIADAPTFETSIGDIADVLKDDGFKDDFIEQFKQSPYSIEYGELRLLHKAANYRKESVSQKQEIETLKAKIAELEKEPGNIIEKINNATKSVTGKSSGTSSPNGKVLDITTLNTRRLSYQQLKEMQKT